MSTDFLYKKNDYLTFDATTMRDLIVARLNESEIFTDQNYLGSNLSALTDVISVIYGSLIFYLNRTSSEALFSEAQLYENINRIVKILNYNPSGRFTQNVLISLAATSNLPQGSYVIPRYSYMYVGSNTYSFNQDVFFSKTTTEDELIESVTNKCLMYQGNFYEFSDYVASGVDFETIVLPDPSLDLNIDHLNIHVYVKNNLTQKWIQWERTEDLYNSLSDDLKYEVRFNENKKYEIKFGDNINGKKLNVGDSVCVFYLACNPKAPSLGKNNLSGFKLKLFNSSNFNDIIEDVQNISIPSYPLDNLNFLVIDNNYSSSNFVSEEGIEQIKTNAPRIFNSQKRLITADDYKSFVSSKFSNLVKDVQVYSNDDYLEKHLKYLYDIGLSAPYLKKTILYNQVNFASTCNFNNVYLYMVPQSNDLRALNQPQKEIILNELNNYKVITSNIVPMEPEYFYIDFYLKNPDTEISSKDLNQSKLRLVKSRNTNRTSTSIKMEAKQIIEDFFNIKNLKLGYFLNITELSSLLSNINGVDRIETYRQDLNLAIPQIFFLLWNETYPDLDKSICSQNTQFENFKYISFFQIENILNRIDVI